MSMCANAKISVKIHQQCNGQKNRIPVQFVHVGFKVNRFKASQLDANPFQFSAFLLCFSAATATATTVAALQSSVFKCCAVLVSSQIINGFSVRLCEVTLTKCAFFTFKVSTREENVAIPLSVVPFRVYYWKKIYCFFHLNSCAT